MILRLMVRRTSHMSVLSDLQGTLMLPMLGEQDNELDRVLARTDGKSNIDEGHIASSYGSAFCSYNIYVQG